MINASKIKIALIKWLLEKYHNDFILGNEVAYSPLIRRADLVMIHNDFSYAFEIKSDYDNIKRLNEQLHDYLKTFDFVYIVTTQTLLKEIEASAPKNVGIILINGSVKQKRKPTLIKRLNKRFLAEFLDRKTIVKNVHKKNLASSIFDLRDTISKELPLNEIRELAIQSLIKRYRYQFSLFLYDVQHSGITEEDLKTLTGCNLSNIH